MDRQGLVDIMGGINHEVMNTAAGHGLVGSPISFPMVVRVLMPLAWGALGL